MTTRILSDIRGQARELLDEMRGRGANFRKWDTIDVCHDLLGQTILGHTLEVADIVSIVDEWLVETYPGRERFDWHRERPMAAE